MAGNVMNLGRLLSDTARRLPDQPALVWRGQSWSWRELDRRVNGLASALRARGTGRGDPILVLARNSNQLFESMWASFKLGAVWTPCNFRLEPPEVAYIARSSGARVMITEAGFEDHAAAVKSDDNAIESVIAIDGEVGDDYEALVDSGGEPTATEADVDYGDPCWFFYTSGTTGRPKAAVLTHGQMAFVVNNHLADLMPGLSWAQDASLVVAPLSHGAGVQAKDTSGSHSQENPSYPASTMLERRPKKLCRAALQRIPNKVSWEKSETIGDMQTNRETNRESVNTSHHPVHTPRVDSALCWAWRISL